LAHTNTVLSQILKIIPRHEFETLANAADGRRKSTALSRWSQFVALTVGQLGQRASLRDIENTLNSQQHLRYHLGSQSVSKSSLARANEQCDYSFYAELFGRLYQRCTQQAPRHGFRFKNKLFSLDGSILSVSLKLFPWANYNTAKAAFKLHVGLDHDGMIPHFVRITKGRVSENEVARELDLPKGSVVVFDKGYNNYQWHKSLTDRGIYWVTRIRGNALYRVLKRNPVNPNSAVTSDQIIEYTAKIRNGDELLPIRRIGYRDPETGKHYVFITNHFKWSAQTIADIYKRRWQVELFFKWIKQNLKIKSFLGTSMNAVLTQVMVALIVYLLLSIIKFQSKVTSSLQQITRLIQMNLFARRSLTQLIFPTKLKPDKQPQLILALTRI
jgi:putative transposase